VYLPLTRDDLERAGIPANGDVTPISDDRRKTKPSSPAAAAGSAAGVRIQHLDSVTTHDVIAPTVSADAVAAGGKVYSAFLSPTLTYWTMRLQRAKKLQMPTSEYLFEDLFFKDVAEMFSWSTPPYVSVVCKFYEFYRHVGLKYVG